MYDVSNFHPNDLVRWPMTDSFHHYIYIYIRPHHDKDIASYYDFKSKVVQRLTHIFTAVDN
jgi:hypothetical protein